MRKKILLASFLCAGLYAQSTEALTPSTAAKLVENTQNQIADVTDSFIRSSVKSAFSRTNLSDQIRGQLWRNDRTGEAVLVLQADMPSPVISFDTVKSAASLTSGLAEGAVKTLPGGALAVGTARKALAGGASAAEAENTDIEASQSEKESYGSRMLGLEALAYKFISLRKSIGYARAQGRLYNDFVKARYPLLAGGVAQKVAAVTVDNVVWYATGVKNLVAQAAAKAYQAYWSRMDEAIDAEINEIDEAGTGKTGAAILSEGFMNACQQLYSDFESELRGFRGTLYVVGHSLGGYIAQHLAYTHDLDGYSFAAMGLGLGREEAQSPTDKVFVNYIRQNDLFSALNNMHYGRVEIVNALPITIVKNLASRYRTLMAGDIMNRRYGIMAEYLVKNHGIEGYADQLAPAQAAAAVTTTTTTTTTSNDHENDAADGA